MMIKIPKRGWSLGEGYIILTKASGKAKGVSLVYDETSTGDDLGAIS